jgi:hypothetical protein
MAKALSIIGGIFAILIVFLGMFVGFFGIWNFSVSGTGVSGSIWINAFCGFTSNLNVPILPALTESVAVANGQNVVLKMFPGIMILVGGIIAVIPKRGTAILGGLLMLAGFVLVVLWLIIGYPYTNTDLKTDINAIALLAPSIQTMPLYGSTTINALLASWTLSWQIGWGALLIIPCGIFALAGAGKPKGK